MSERGYTHDQYIRRWNLTLSGSGGSKVLTTSDKPGGVDLRMHFECRQSDGPTPNTAIVTVYNLKDETAMDVIQEFDAVQLEAGYITGHYGIIFKGSIKQYKKGKESAVDTYLTLYCADGGIAHEEATVSHVFPEGSSFQDHLDYYNKSYKAAEPALTDGQVSSAGLQGGVLPRQRMIFGMTADEIRPWAKSTGMVHSVQNGEITVSKQGDYLPGDIVVLTAATGLIGIPEATQEGIYVTSLLNPAIRVKGRIQLSNRSIDLAQYYVPGGGQAVGVQRTGPGSPLEYFAVSARDGVYTVGVIDYEGDTRGLPWYNKMMCLATDSLSGGFGGVQADIRAGSIGFGPRGG